MRFLTLFFIAFTFSCAEEEAPELDCRLTKIVVTGGNYESQTEYTYNASSKMDRQVRTTNGIIVFDYTYSYNSAGNVDKVGDINSYSEYEYATDGKLASITFYTNADVMFQKYLYTWSGDDVEIKLTKPSIPNPFQITSIEFVNGNAVKYTYKSFTGNEPNVLTNLSEQSYEDFDTALSAFYIASSTRPGYSVETSKNNPRKRITKTTFYDGGVVVQEGTSTTIYAYTYNATNATITSTSTTDGTVVEDTVITYEQCL